MENKDLTLNEFIEHIQNMAVNYFDNAFQRANRLLNGASTTNKIMESSNINYLFGSYHCCLDLLKKYDVHMMIKTIKQIEQKYGSDDIIYKVLKEFCYI